MRTRRGLSTVVGMVFSIIALMTTMVYVSHSTNLLDQYNNSLLAKNQALSDAYKEKFQIASVTVVKNKMNVTLANTGNLPINFTKIWIQNTSATDWTRSYVTTNSFVAPGATLINLGQSIPAYINPANSYNIKLVTSKGNSQSFNMNSASATPLNIQLLTIPSTLASGMTTQLVMIITNNSTSNLANISPSTPTLSGSSTATCTLGSVSPTSYNTLPPGGTAVFSWSLKVSGASGKTCIYTAMLQNGFPGNTAQTTATVTLVNLATSTTYASNSGILTINYTTFRWSQGNGWQTGWAVPNSKNTVFKIDITNNNSTAGTNFYFSKYSQFVLIPDVPNGNGWPWYIVNATNVNNTSPSITSYDCGNHDYCISIPPSGTATLYFGVDKAGAGASIPNSPSISQYIAFIIIYGKYSASSGGGGTSYGQNIPVMGVLTT